jgi:uncharacterized protein (TIGR02270 family)
MINETVFSMGPDTPPAVRILPSLEALVSVRLGDDPSRMWEFWNRLVRDIRHQTPYVFDNRPEDGMLQPATDMHHEAVQQAFEAACRGPGGEPRIDWANMKFVDTSDPDGLPEHSICCSIGWVESAEAPRGFSLQLTVPYDYSLEKLVDLGRDLATNWPGLWRWIGIGYRFVPVCWHSKYAEDARKIVFCRSRRFLGVDVGEQFGLYTSFWQDRIRTVHWCTIVSPFLLDKLPEGTILPHQPRLPTEIEPIGNSLLFRAGAGPSLCDVNRLDDTTGYLAADRILRPIRAGRHVNFLSPWDAESTGAWLERFNISGEDRIFSPTESEHLFRPLLKPYHKIISRHAVDAAILWIQRERVLASNDHDLEALCELDNRLFANIEGLELAGEPGWQACQDELEYGGAEALFAAAVVAFGCSSEEWISFILEKAADDGEMLRAIISALGWLSYDRAGPHIKKMLSESSPDHQRIGIAASAIQRVDPGKPLADTLSSDNHPLRARALKAVGELGRIDLLPQIKASFDHKDPVCRFRAAWTATLLGDTTALPLLKTFAIAPFPHHKEALCVAFRRMSLQDTLNWHSKLSRTPENLRFAVIGTGVIGDPALIPWLIKQMETPALARVAGEELSMITGVDITGEKLEGECPEGFGAGPTGKPDDENVEMDPDEDLPWPNPELVIDWWENNKTRFNNGTRHLLGLPITEENLQQVLRTGRQRQRHAAALELAIMTPGQSLFEISAPGFRQKIMLGLK